MIPTFPLVSFAHEEVDALGSNTETYMRNMIVPKMSGKTMSEICCAMCVFDVVCGGEIIHGGARLFLTDPCTRWGVM